MHVHRHLIKVLAIVSLAAALAACRPLPAHFGGAATRGATVVVTVLVDGQPAEGVHGGAGIGRSPDHAVKRSFVTNRNGRAVLRGPSGRWEIGAALERLVIDGPAPACPILTDDAVVQVRAGATARVTLRLATPPGAICSGGPL